MKLIHADAPPALDITPAPAALPPLGLSQLCCPDNVKMGNNNGSRRGRRGCCARLARYIIRSVGGGGRFPQTKLTRTRVNEFDRQRRLQPARMNDKIFCATRRFRRLFTHARTLTYCTLYVYCVCAPRERSRRPAGYYERWSLKAFFVFFPRWDWIAAGTFPTQGHGEREGERVIAG